MLGLSKLRDTSRSQLSPYGILLHILKPQRKAALLPFGDICWLQIVVAGWDGEAREGGKGEAVTAEQNSVILSQVWEDPQRSNCRTEVAVNGLGWWGPRWIKNSQVYVLGSPRKVTCLLWALAATGG